jgi:hypothetical protein
LGVNTLAFSGYGTVGNEESGSANKLRDITRQYIELMDKECHKFWLWQKEYIVQKDPPSPEDLAQHRDTLKWLLRATRLIQMLAADPDFPDHSLRGQIEAIIWSLQESWEMIYSPMPEQEAKRVLTEVFPDEQGA